MERLPDLLELLDGIKVQTYTNHETILIVEKSAELMKRLQEYAAANSQRPVRVVFNSGEPGLSAARNMGIRESRGDIIAFIDDDAVPATDWAQAMVETYADDSVIGVTGAISPLWRDSRADWFPPEFDWILSCSSFSGAAELRDVRNAYGANMSFRRAAFDVAGMFSIDLGAKGGGTTGKHELVGDETELSIRVRRKSGKRIVFSPAVVVHHKVYAFRITPGFVARRAYWEGYSKALFRQVFRSRKDGQRTLHVEYDLLRRVVTRLVPGSIAGLFVHPRWSWRRLALTTNALAFVAIGYFSFEFRRLIGRDKTVLQLRSREA